MVISDLQTYNTVPVSCLHSKFQDLFVSNRNLINFEYSILAYLICFYGDGHGYEFRRAINIGDLMEMSWMMTIHEI